MEIRVLPTPIIWCRSNKIKEDVPRHQFWCVALLLNMSEKKHSFFMFRRGDKRLSEIITQKAREGNIFTSISPLGIITFKKGNPSDHIYRVEDPDLPRDLRLYDPEIFEEIFRSRSYVVFRSKKPVPKEFHEEAISFEAWEYEQETEWLADKAKEGLFLYNKRAESYYFVKGEPGEYTYRIDFRVIKSPKDYLEEFHSAGWDYVCSSKHDHYFIRKGNFREKTSVKPQVKALKKKIRFRWFLFWSLFALIAVGGVFVVLGIISEPTNITRKILFYGIGGFFVVAAISIAVSVMKGLHALRKRNRLLKYRGE